MSDEQVANTVVLTIVGGLLAIGLLSMLVGQLANIYDWFRAQMADSLDRAREEMARKHMSSGAKSEDDAADMDAVYIPVWHTGMPIDPRDLARDISEEQLFEVLTLFRGMDGKPRYSANAIHALVGGDRNTTLARIRELRSEAPPPVFPPLSPEQQQKRAAIGLTK